MRSGSWCAAALAGLTLGLPPFAPAGPPPAARGSLVMAGGALRFSNTAVWDRFAQLAGGKGAAVVIIPAAAVNPTRSGQLVIDHLKGYHIDARLLPLAPGSPGGAARDPETVSRLRKAQGIWFVGGDQQRITATLLEVDGSPTPALEAIRDAYRAGAVVGGTSAGAAVMSGTMFTRPESPLETLKNGLTPGKHTGPGLGFLGGEWLIDQHFLARGRFARALVAMARTGHRLALGVDEDTAVVLRDGQFEVVGYNGALVLDLNGAEVPKDAVPFRLAKARLTYLDSGDRLDLATRQVKVGPLKLDQKIDPAAPDFRPTFTSPAATYFADMLGPGVITKAMRNALDSKRGVVTGLAFAQPEGGKQNDLGFEFKIYRGKDTLGWSTSRAGYETYTIVNSYLDITPVRLAPRLYTPLTP